MKTGKAVAIFEQIDSDKFTADEKAEAIYKVLQMPTHNGISKDTILRVVKHLFNLCYDVVEDET